MSRNIVREKNSNAVNDKFIKKLKDQMVEKKFSEMSDSEKQKFLVSVTVEFTKEGSKLAGDVTDAVLDTINDIDLTKFIIEEVLPKNDFTKYFEKFLNDVNYEKIIIDELKPIFEKVSGVLDKVNKFFDGKKLLEAVDKYDKTKNDQDLIEMTLIGADLLSDIISGFGPMGKVCAELLNFGKKLIGTSTEMITDFIFQRHLLEAQVLASTPENTLGSENKFILRYMSDRKHDNFVLFDKKLSAMILLDNKFKMIFGSTFGEVNFQEALISSSPEYKKIMDNINKTKYDIVGSYKYSIDKNGVIKLHNEYLFAKDGTITETKNTVGSASSARTSADPLVFDLGGNGLHPSGLKDGVYFDMNGDGKAEKMNWVVGDDALLVFDRNGNGIVDDGNELFSNYTLMGNGTLAPSGLAALIELDENKDGVIDEKDAIFSRLRLWVDNGNGITEAGELRTLSDLEIKSINLNNLLGDTIINGVEVKNQGSFTRTDGSEGRFGEYWEKPNFSDTIDEIGEN